MVEIRTYTEALMLAEDRPRNCVAGDVVFREGDAASEMYVVREGAVELRKGRVVLETLGPGGVFGEMALIDPAPRSATAVAVTDAKLVVVDGITFSQLVRKVPGLALEMMRLVVRRLRKELTRERGVRRRPKTAPRAARGRSRPSKKGGRRAAAPRRGRRR